MKLSMYRHGITKAIALALLCLGLSAVPGVAADAPPYELETELSLTGDCSTPAPDFDPDPGCPGGSHPPSGRFNEPRSVAIDAYGNEYVASYAQDGEKGRIDVFDHEGRFITELLDPHGPKSVAVDSKGNLYVLEQRSGTYSTIVRYAPSLYKPETGEIKYEEPRVVISTIEFLSTGGIAVDFSNDRLLVATSSSVREYSSAVEGNKLLNTITHEKLKQGNWVAIDSQRRRLFASTCRVANKECGVLVLEADAPYALLKEIDGSTVPAGKFFSENGLLSIAVNEANGHFFIDDLGATKRVYEFDENYEYFSKVESSSFQGGNALQIAVSNSPLKEDARNREYLFVPVLFAAGRVLAFKPPAERPPMVESLVATNIGETEAEIRAVVNPEGGATEYRIEYVTEGSFEESEFAAATVAGQGTIPEGSQPQQLIALISGLVPGQSYRFRAVAKNLAGEDEQTAGFTTYSDAPITETCSNQSLRSGASRFLPDCRAYELVTPADTNGKPTKGSGVEGDRFGMLQSSPLGGAVSFEMFGGALPGTEGTGAFHGDAYKATRFSSGWGTVLAGPSARESNKPIPGSFSPDQGYSFWVAGGEGTAVLGGELTRYVRYPDGHSELIGRGSLGTDPTTAAGKLITEGGGHIIFQTDPVGSAQPVQLEPNAPPTGTEAVYDRTSDEVTHVVSLLPGNVTPAAGEDAAYRGASADGQGIAFAIGSTLYLRKDNMVTYEIGENVTFAGVSEGGERIFYLKGGDLFAFDTEAEAHLPFTAVADATVVNVAPDGSRAYFATTKVIPGGGQNPNGAFADAGEQNLYLSEEGQISFVATVTDRDVEGELDGSGVRYDGLGIWAEALAKRLPGTVPSRLTPDGKVFLFQSRANLDGYDPGGFPQVFRYDTAANRLDCLSCPPTGSPATGGAKLQSFVFDDLDAPFASYGFVPNLASGGSRVFFESTEPLVSGDTDEVRDVYEWEEQGVGSCERAGGCVYLISSGHSNRDNYLFGHSQSGDDVFFTTTDILVAGDQETSSVYDARVNGGFASASLPICDTVEACRGPAGSAPAAPTPTSEAIGRLQEPRRSCPKGKRKVKRAGKVVCVKKHRKGKTRKKNKQRRKAAAKRVVAR